MCRFEEIIVETVCKFGNAELLEDEFKALQVKLEMMKNYVGFTDVAQNLVGEKDTNIENFVNNPKENINQIQSKNKSQN